MARALYPEEESAFDYKIVELDTSQRKCLNRKFYAAIFSVLLLLALGGTLLLRKTGVPAGTTPSIQNNYTVTSTDAIVRVDYNNAGEETSTVVNDANIKEWESYLRFEEAAPLEPVMPSQNAIFFQNYLPSYGNVSLHCEVHPKDRCLLILSRKMLTDDELADSTKFRACYGRLERNLRATYELYDIELGFLLPYCANIPLVPLIQKCKSPS